jgi:hypothetical protein
VLPQPAHQIGDLFRGCTGRRRVDVDEQRDHVEYGIPYVPGERGEAQLVDAFNDRIANPFLYVFLIERPAVLSLYASVPVVSAIESENHGDRNVRRFPRNVNGRAFRLVNQISQSADMR